MYNTLVLGCVSVLQDVISLDVGMLLLFGGHSFGCSPYKTGVVLGSPKRVASAGLEKASQPIIDWLS